MPLLDTDISFENNTLKVLVRGYGNFDLAKTEIYLEKFPPSRVEVSVLTHELAINERVYYFLERLAKFPISTYKVFLDRPFTLSQSVEQLETNIEMDLSCYKNLETYIGPYVGPLSTVKHVKIQTALEYLDQSMLIKNFPKLESYDIKGKFKFGSSKDTFTRFTSIVV